MSRVLFLASLLLLLFASLAVAKKNDYCEDSEFDPAMTSRVAFERGQDWLDESYALFKRWTRDANMTSNAVLQDIADRLLALVPQYRARDPLFTGWTITRSSGIIIIDTNSATTGSPVNPDIENHNTRYEFAKAIQCRDQGAPVVYEKYFVPRLQRSSQFWAEAIQTGLDNTWFVFRINFRVAA